MSERRYKDVTDEELEKLFDKFTRLHLGIDGNQGRAIALAIVGLGLMAAALDVVIDRLAWWELLMLFGGTAMLGYAIFLNATRPNYQEMAQDVLEEMRRRKEP